MSHSCSLDMANGIPCPQAPQYSQLPPLHTVQVWCHGGGHLLSSSLTLAAIAVGVAVPIAVLCTLLVISTIAVMVARKKISKSRMVCMCVCVCVCVCGLVWVDILSAPLSHACRHLFLMSHDMWHREVYRCSYMLGTPVTMGALC